MQTNTTTTTTSLKLKDLLADFSALVKLRLSITVVFSSVLAFLIAGGGSFGWLAVLTLAIGGFLVTAAANILNEVLEKEYDKKMQRTANRPIAAGRMEVSTAVMLAGFFSLFGISLLAMFNPWTALFGMISLLTYSFLYTPLKRMGPVAVTVGAIPGALPVLIGCVAAEGHLSGLALSLFAIQFCWQFPHFWSIGFLGYADYRKAGFVFVPGEGEKVDRQIGRSAFGYGLLTIIASVLPYLLGYLPLWTAIFGASLSLMMAVLAWRFWQRFERASALRLMFFSFAYIPLILMAYVLGTII